MNRFLEERANLAEIDSMEFMKAEAVMQYILAAPLFQQELEHKYCGIINRFKIEERNK